MADSYEPYNGLPPFVSGSDTSEAASETLSSPTQLRAQVFAFLVAEGDNGATDEEMQQDIPMPANTQRPRRRELVLQGAVEDSGRRRPTDSGKQAVVWWVKRRRTGPESAPSVAIPPEPPLWDPEEDLPDWVRNGEPVERLYTGPTRGVSTRELDILDRLVPPEYRGRTWDYPSQGEIIHCRFPPMRDDPQGPVTQEFIDFQDWGGRVTREDHPEYYCVDCRAVYVSAICTYPDCRSARVGPTGRPRVAQGTPYRCLECRREFYSALLCGLCRTKLGDAAGQLPLPLPRPGSIGTKRRPRRDDNEVYPD